MEYEAARIAWMVKKGYAEWSLVVPGNFYLTDSGRRWLEREEGWPAGILG